MASSAIKEQYKVPSTSKISVEKLLRVGCYNLEKTIGKGNFAVVKLASNIITKSKVAIKIIDKTCLNDEYLAKTFREISILKKLRHRHITRLYEVMQSETMIYLVTEYASNGEIFDHLVENGRMKEPEAARVFTQLVSAVDYCHSKGVVHRDLKAENVLLDKDMNIKLADFGFSNQYEEGSFLTTWCGSPPYAAPEVFQGLEYDGPKADIWSLGVVLYALVCGALPFDGKTLLELKSRVVTGKFRIPYFMSQDCEHLIRNMLVVEPDRRFTLKQIIKHRWLSEWIAEVERECQNIAEPFILASNSLFYGRRWSDEKQYYSSQPTSVPNLDSVVVSHMLQLSGLTADKIAQSVHENRFDNIYAIYYLLYDKLQQKRIEYRRISQHVNKTRPCTSITTGVVDRSEFLHQETLDRLSPLNNTGVTQTGNEFEWSDVSINLEKYSDIDLDCLQRINENFNQCQLASTPSPVSATGNTRRHTVGPGDVAHEQALQDSNAVPLDFKNASSNYQQPSGNYPPINLPMLQNQPLHYLTIKDQHLLKPPLVMGATGLFNRRASDGGANLPYCFTAGEQQQNQIQHTHNIPPNTFFINPPVTEMTVSREHKQFSSDETSVESSLTIQDDRSDEVQRYMKKRGCSKRHTVGCTDDLSSNPTTSEQQHLAHMSKTVTNPLTTGVATPNSGCVSSGIRTRRTGLLTVTERPPVISPELIREVESRMNRNYLPPGLALQNNKICINQSPSTLSSGQSYTGSTFFSSPASSGFSLSVSGPSSSASATPTANSYTNRRIYGKACKLPPVQEVGRYSPVRRASEGSKGQFQGPLQECQYLQKGIAQRNFLVAPNQPALENSISLPGSPIHGKPSTAHIFRKIGESTLVSARDIEVSEEALKSIIPILNQLVKDERISVEMLNKILSTKQMPMYIAEHLGLIAHNFASNSGANADRGEALLQQQMLSLSASPLSLPNSANSSHINMSDYSPISGVGIANSGPLEQLENTTQNTFILQANSARGLQSKQLLGKSSTQTGFNSSGAFGTSANSSFGCQMPICSSYSGTTSPNSYMPNTPVFYGSSSQSTSPLHQITKGISYLTTGGGGSITRGTSAACETANQPLDLSMDVSSSDDFEMPQGPLASQNWFTPPSQYYDLKPLNLSPIQPARLVSTPPTSPNLCIIQEENANGQLYHTITTGTPYAGCTGGITSNACVNLEEDTASHREPHSYPQICLTDVQGSEITLVALSSENSRESERNASDKNTAPLMSLQGLLITEPSSEMPSITRGIGRKTSLETDFNTVMCQHSGSSTKPNDRRGSDKSLGFSDDSLSNDSNNLSPCQEPSASSGFKSETHSEMGDQTEGHLTPDSMCDSRRMSEDMFYEVPLSHECSNLDTTQILQMVRQTIESTMPPKGFILHTSDDYNTTPLSSVANANFSTEGRLSTASTGTTDSSFYSIDISTSSTPANLSLEYSGGLQIEVQVCEGRSKDNQTTSKGIKLRRISGDHIEYGKLCQQLISQLTVQQVAV